MPLPVAPSFQLNHPCHGIIVTQSTYIEEQSRSDTWRGGQCSVHRDAAAYWPPQYLMQGCSPIRPGRSRSRARGCWTSAQHLHLANGSPKRKPQNGSLFSGLWKGTLELRSTGCGVRSIFSVNISVLNNCQTVLVRHYHAFALDIPLPDHVRSIQ